MRQPAILVVKESGQLHWRWLTSATTWFSSAHLPGLARLALTWNLGFWHGGAGIAACYWTHSLAHAL
jgi:hypothetical protein